MSESTPNKDMPVIDTSAEAHTSQASSDADIPVEIPFFASIEIVKAVCILDLFFRDINGNFNLST